MSPYVKLFTSAVIFLMICKALWHYFRGEKIDAIWFVCLAILNAVYVKE